MELIVHFSIQKSFNMLEYANIFLEIVAKINNASFHMIFRNINANFSLYQIIVIRENANFRMINGRMIYREHNGMLIMNNIDVII